MYKLAIYIAAAQMITVACRPTTRDADDQVLVSIPEGEDINDLMESIKMAIDRARSRPRPTNNRNSIIESVFGVDLTARSQTFIFNKRTRELLGRLVTTQEPPTSEPLRQVSQQQAPSCDCDCSRPSPCLPVKTYGTHKKNFPWRRN